MLTMLLDRLTGFLRRADQSGDATKMVPSERDRAPLISPVTIGLLEALGIRHAPTVVRPEVVHPDIVVQPEPTIVDPRDPVIVEPRDPVIVTQPPPTIITQPAPVIVTPPPAQVVNPIVVNPPPAQVVDPVIVQQPGGQ